MSAIKDDRGYNQCWMPSKAWLARTDRRCNVIVKNFDKKKAKILEIGCGTGLLSNLIAGRNKDYQVVGTDICRPFIKKAANRFKRKNLKYSVLDFNDKKAVQKLIQSEGKFDFITGDGILHHLYWELDSTIKQLKSLLKNAGKILFLEPNILNPYCFLIFKVKSFRVRANLEPGEMAFKKLEIKRILESKEFSKIKIVHKDFLLPNTPAFMIGFVSLASNCLEYIPLINKLSQSIFISAQLSK